MTDRETDRIVVGWMTAWMERKTKGGEGEEKWFERSEKLLMKKKADQRV